MPRPSRGPAIGDQRIRNTPGSGGQWDSPYLDQKILVPAPRRTVLHTLRLAQQRWRPTRIFSVYIVGYSQSGTKVLRVPEFYEGYGGDLQRVSSGICGRCVERWEYGHTGLGQKVRAMFPDVLELKG